jgi:hypothetical protein
MSKDVGGSLWSYLQSPEPQPTAAEADALAQYLRAPTPYSSIVLLTPRDTAKHLNCDERTLERHRLVGDGPPYVKLGGLVRYPLDQLERWIAANLRHSTSEPAATLPAPSPAAANSAFIAGRPTPAIARQNRKLRAQSTPTKPARRAASRSVTSEPAPGARKTRPVSQKINPTAGAEPVAQQKLTRPKRRARGAPTESHASPTPRLSHGRITTRAAAQGVDAVADVDAVQAGEQAAGKRRPLPRQSAPTPGRKPRKVAAETAPMQAEEP